MKINLVNDRLKFGSGLYEYCFLSIQGNGGIWDSYYVELNYSPAFLMKVLANMAVYECYADCMFYLNIY